MAVVHRHGDWSISHKRTVALAALAVSVAALGSMAILRANLGNVWVPAICKPAVSAQGLGANQHLAEGQARTRWRTAVLDAHGQVYAAAPVLRRQQTTCSSAGNAVSCTFVAKPCVYPI